MMLINQSKIFHNYQILPLFPIFFTFSIHILPIFSFSQEKRHCAAFAFFSDCQRISRTENCSLFRTLLICLSPGTLGKLTQKGSPSKHLTMKSSGSVFPTKACNPRKKRRKSIDSLRFSYRMTNCLMSCRLSISNFCMTWEICRFTV